MDGFSVKSEFSGLSYVVKVVTFGHQHRQVIPSNHAFQANSNESNEGVSVPSILHLIYQICEIGVT